MVEIFIIIVINFQCFSTKKQVHTYLFNGNFIVFFSTKNGDILRFAFFSVFRNFLLVAKILRNCVFLLCNNAVFTNQSKP